jgi:hypothetical protein
VTKKTLYIDKESIRKHVAGRKFVAGLQRRVKADRQGYLHEVRNMKTLGNKILKEKSKHRRELVRGFWKASKLLKKYSLRRMPLFPID